jgi:hypothetical protein
VKAAIITSDFSPIKALGFPLLLHFLSQALSCPLKVSYVSEPATRMGWIHSRPDGKKVPLRVIQGVRESISFWEMQEG